MSKVQLFALFCLLLCSVFASEANPFYVKEGTVHKTDKEWNFKLLNHNPPSPLDSRNPELMHGDVTIKTLDKSVLHLKIINDTGARWEAPLYNPEPGKDYNPGHMGKMGFTFENDPFTFEITEPGTGTKLLSTKLQLGGSLKYFDKLIELGLWYPSKRIFGYGERTTPDFELCHSRENCKYTIFNADALNPLDIGEPPGAKQTYGTHPFYMIQLNNGKFIASFFLNTNAQEIEITKLDGGNMNLYHRTVGGIIELYFFYPDTADTVVKKYHDLIGRPYLPPFWALGYHQCRWGWKTLDKVKDVVANFEQYDIPLEVMWADIDYMLEYTDFTVDPVRYKGLSEFVENLHKRQMRWVPIVDAGLNYSETDKYIIEGEKNNALIKSALHKGKTFIGRVWPGYTAYIDFFSPYADTLWQMGLGDLSLQVNFDGIWLDMNEAANFCDGECFKTNITESDPADPHDPTEFDNLPYVPGDRPLNVKTIDMAAYHYSTTPDEDRFRKEFNVHSIWGILEGKSTHEFFLKRNRRPFIVTRASYAGSGMYVSIWGGDNYSTWEYMRYSIISVFNLQLFGMPLTGVDICGFIGHTTEELCARWMQLGAFYPFSRNHNELNGRDQEPYVFGEKVAKTSRNAIRQKYSILHYYYTQLYEITLYGGMMYQPLFFEFPNDQNAYLNRNNTFLVGDDLLVAPVLYKDAKWVTTYLPNANWYDLRTREQLTTYNPNNEEGTIKVFDASYDYVNVLIRGGAIIPFQDAISAKVRRTEILRYLPMELIIAPDHIGFAHGSLIVDDGDSINAVKDKLYRHYAFNFMKEKKVFEVVLINDYENHFDFEKFWRLTILGAEDMKDDVKACVENKEGFIADVPGVYDSAKKAMTYQLGRSKLYWSDIKKISFGQNCYKLKSEQRLLTLNRC
eukprot:TRINITY_DN111_c0_g2_i2.p1 TRINITY_DN111_c0_g2~~TRINITY_DN111_c0_g2_i2.p1  ORF type:complete len:957 (+),score=79.93 TRINITY_DN111_c0_g2_i2:153-2873(+)